MKCISNNLVLFMVDVKYFRNASKLLNSLIREY